MDRTSGSVSHEDAQGSTHEEMLFTYSEDERQQNEINRENAKLIFSPEFIPFYPAVKKKYNLTDKETLLFGFIKFYLGATNNARFYFTNEQIGSLLSCSEKHISISLKSLKNKGLITMSYRLKANGGKIRYVTNVISEITYRLSRTLPTGKENKNKINNNILPTVTTSLGDPDKKEKKEYGNTDINKILSYLKQTFSRDDFKESTKEQRIYGKHLFTLSEKIGKEDFKKRCATLAEDAFLSKNCGSLRYIYGQLKSMPIQKRPQAAANHNEAWEKEMEQRRRDMSPPNSNEL